MPSPPTKRRRTVSPTSARSPSPPRSHQSPQPSHQHSPQQSTTTHRPHIAGFDDQEDLPDDDEQRSRTLSAHSDPPDTDPNELDEEHCAICLSPIQNKTVVFPCHHGQFCWNCIRAWTDQSRKCPLCLGPIEHLIHNIRSAKDYQTHYLLPLSSLTSTSPSDYLPPRGTRRPQIQQPLPRHALYGRNRHSSAARLNEADETTWREREEERALERRRYIYREGLFAKHVASNRYTGFKTFTPQTFANNPELKSRVIKFVRRELQIFPTVDISFLTTYLISIASQLDLRSAAAIRLISDFLSEQDAQHLVHEITTFARSPFTSLEGYDRFVQYGRPERAQPKERENEEMIIDTVELDNEPRFAENMKRRKREEEEEQERRRPRPLPSLGRGMGSNNLPPRPSDDGGGGIGHLRLCLLRPRFTNRAGEIEMRGIQGRTMPRARVGGIILEVEKVEEAEEGIATKTVRRLVLEIGVVEGGPPLDLLRLVGPSHPAHEAKEEGTVARPLLPALLAVLVLAAVPSPTPTLRHLNHGTAVPPPLILLAPAHYHLDNAPPPFTALPTPALAPPIPHLPLAAAVPESQSQEANSHKELNPELEDAISLGAPSLSSVNPTPRPGTPASGTKGGRGGGETERRNRPEPQQLRIFGAARRILGNGNVVTLREGGGASLSASVSAGVQIRGQGAGRGRGGMGGKGKGPELVASTPPREPKAQEQEPYDAVPSSSSSRPGTPAAAAAVGGKSLLARLGAFAPPSPGPSASTSTSHVEGESTGRGAGGAGEDLRSRLKERLMAEYREALASRANGPTLSATIAKAAAGAGVEKDLRALLRSRLQAEKALAHDSRPSPSSSSGLSAAAPAFTPSFLSSSPADGQLSGVGAGGSARATFSQATRDLLMARLEEERLLAQEQIEIEADEGYYEDEEEVWRDEDSQVRAETSGSSMQPPGNLPQQSSAFPATTSLSTSNASAPASTTTQPNASASDGTGAESALRAALLAKRQAAVEDELKKRSGELKEKLMRKKLEELKKKAQDKVKAG
ncbi:hypothetical protein JCM11641_004920 [Rhodosporidiobolus odoratus]